MTQLHIIKTFTRKIKVDGVFYLVHQNQKLQMLVITRKDTRDDIYIHTKNGTRYREQDKQLIERIFDMAHIDRYMVKNSW